MIFLLFSVIMLLLALCVITFYRDEAVTDGLVKAMLTLSVAFALYSSFQLFWRLFT